MSEILKDAIKSEFIVKDTQTAALQSLCKNVLEVLYKHYPGHLWMVKADDGQGVVFIFNARISGSEGYILHIENLTNYTILEHRVMQAGGEVLERFGMSRGRVKENDAKDIIRDYKGEALQK